MHDRSVEPFGKHDQLLVGARASRTGENGYPVAGVHKIGEPSEIRIARADRRTGIRHRVRQVSASHALKGYVSR